MKSNNKKLIILWALLIIIVLCCLSFYNVDNIVHYTPNNLWLCAIAMMMLFALKSVSIVLYSGLLYTAINIMFPAGVDFILCYLGALIAITIPYFIGKKKGTIILSDIETKYPKLKKLSNLQQKHPIIATFIYRATPVFSLDIISMYLGATKLNYLEYVIGSLLGMTPNIMICNGLEELLL